jgi:hypothetical protein
MTAERLRHLALAVLINPRHTVARGLMGLVEDAGRWRKPEEVAVKAKADAEQAAKLAEYNVRRAQMKDTVQAHWNLAVWCDENKLGPEATAHYTAITRLDPTREAAWKRLGYQRHKGRWMTREQIASQIAEREAQAAANRRWQPRLERWRRELKFAGKRATVETLLTDVTDPRAVPAIWRVFASGEADEQAIAVRLLGQIRGEASSRALALVATFGDTVEVRRAAAETLTWRDDREFLSLLIGLLRDPVRYAVVGMGADGLGSPGMLVMETPDESVTRLYPSALETAGVLGPDLAERAQREPRVQQVINASLRADAQRQQDIEAEVAQIEQSNAGVNALNDTVWRALSMIRRPDPAKVDPEALRVWAADVQGYAYRKYSQPRRVLFQVVTPPPAYDCFAAGTVVRTRSGLRPIEEIKVGDQILSQNTWTGALGYRPVLAAHHYPPAATLRIGLQGETVIATGIHRFWKPGQGWALARDLKPGDTVRVVGGTKELKSLSPDTPRPVYNLEVAEGHSFFVGKAGALVHDDSLEALDAEPFDAVPAPK